MAYLEFPITTDVNQIRQDIIEAIQEQFPGWDYDTENAIEVWLIEGFVALIADLKILAAEVPPEILREFGKQIMGITPGLAVGSTFTATIVAQDLDGHTLEAGTTVGLRRSADELVAFTLQYDVVIPKGESESEPKAAVFRAVEPGKQGNELTGPYEDITSNLAWVEDIVLTAESSGGEDAQSPLDYLNKLREKMQQLSPKLIVARDFEIEARNTEGIFAAFAEDNYDAELNEEEVGNVVTMWLRDEQGQPVSEDAKIDLAEAIEKGRTQNFKFYLLDATYNGIDIKTKVRCLPGYDKADVQARLKEALETFASPAKFALSAVSEDVPIWVNRTVFRYKEVVAAIDRVVGVDYIEELKIAKDGSALEEKDVNLTGRVPLTEPKDIEVEAVDA